MTMIFKYVLQPGRTVLEMPEGAKPLTVQMQNDAVCMWAQVQRGNRAERRFFDVYGTGHPMPADPGDYVATFQMEGGALVWHVFDSTRCA